jgi:hypothetical protein
MDVLRNVANFGQHQDLRKPVFLTMNAKQSRFRYQTEQLQQFIFTEK